MTVSEGGQHTTEEGGQHTTAEGGQHTTEFQEFHLSFLGLEISPALPCDFYSNSWGGGMSGLISTWIIEE